MKSGKMIDLVEKTLGEQGLLNIALPALFDALKNEKFEGARAVLQFTDLIAQNLSEKDLDKLLSSLILGLNNCVPNPPPSGEKEKQ